MLDEERLYAWLDQQLSFVQVRPHHLEALGLPVEDILGPVERLVVTGKDGASYDVEPPWKGEGEGSRKGSSHREVEEVSSMEEGSSTGAPDTEEASMKQAQPERLHQVGGWVPEAEIPEDLTLELVTLPDGRRVLVKRKQSSPPSPDGSSDGYDLLNKVVLGEPHETES
ncbi:hypothetical protein ACO1O0_000788 [Amphichorda felina]